MVDSDVEVITPTGIATTFAAAGGDDSRWLDAKHGDKKVNRMLLPVGGAGENTRNPTMI